MVASLLDFVENKNPIVMDIQIEDKTADVPSALVLPAGFAASLKPHASIVINGAKKNGVISTREIAAIIRPEAISNRYTFKDTIAHIGRYLREIGVVLAKGQADLDRRLLPLPLIARISIPRFKNLTELDLKALASIGEKNGGEFDTSELALYQGVIRKFPLLNSKEVTTLFERRAEGDLEAQHLLVLHNLRLVFSWANKYRNRGLDFSDLAQEGILGLMKAIEKFDWARGFMLSTYASWWIKQRITRAIEDKARSIRLPVHLAERFYKIKRAQETLTHNLGREATPEEIGEKLKILPRYVSKILNSVYGTESVSLEVDPNEESEVSTGLHQAIADPHSVSPSSTLEAKEALEEAVADTRKLLVAVAALPALDDRYSKIFRMRYGLDGVFFSRPTLEVVGQKFGLTRERIRQVVNVVWKRLQQIGIHGDDDSFVKQLAHIEELETVTSTFAKI